ncbi:hypothetical protein P9139_07055 [Curtobacterium flaccumfaciens]|nr:hypothetical protein P9139_07055 [Curtobacterium flaccumfaciens]
MQYAIGGDITRYNMFPFSTVGFQALNVEGPTQGDVVIGGINTFTGTATPGANVEIIRKDTGQVIARGTGEGEHGIWNAKTELRTGTSYQLEAVQTALNGKTDTVDLGTITPVASQGITDLAFTHNGDIDDANNITFTFRAQPGAEVSVWTGAKEEAGTDKPWIRQMASGTADKYGKVKISGYAAINNPYNLKVYAGTQVVDYTITTTPTK